MNIKLFTAFILVHQVNAHSWIEKIESPYGSEGVSRIGLDVNSDSYRQRYFCPLSTLDECQPDAKHNIVLDESALRPCRADMISNPKAVVKPGSDLILHWAGNGHVGNGQSDGTCVRVMMTDYANDPSFTNFTDVPGAECLDFWITAEDDGSQQPQGTIHIPATTPEGPYTLLWYWDFTEFWYSACIDIEVTNNVTVGNTPSPTITPDVADDAEIQVYLHNGCSGLDDSTTFCQEYTTDPNSYCNVNEVDECGRSICTGIANFLFECPQNCPVGCPIPKAFYDDFSSNTLDEYDWLVAEKSWGSSGQFLNGGVVPENVQSDSSAGTVKFNAHGNLYTGDVMGINKDLSRQNTGVRAGGAIATRRYLGPGSYEVRMKVAGELGVCSAIWTFFYNDDEYCESGADIVNHEIDIELPGRPGAPSTNIDFAQALTNTWTGEIGSLQTTGYTSLPKNVDDGEFHTYRFDWHTDPADRRVEFYLDGDYLTTITTDVPFFAGRMWLGAWFPNSWAGEPNFDVEVMEVDYFKFTPFDEDYECLAESYPNFGWASGTNFDIGNDEQLCGTYTSSPTTHVTKSPTSQPTHSPSSPPQSTGNYLDIGCADLPNVCSTYCKDYAGQQDSCGRSVCHGDSHSDLNPCPSPTTSPVTSSPITSSPITASPTTSSPTDAPTNPEITPEPSQSPVTSSPTDQPTDSPVTLSPTDSPTKAPTNTQSSYHYTNCGASHKIGAPGCGGVAEAAAEDEELHEVRCCADTNLGTGWNQPNSCKSAFPNTWGESQINGICYPNKNFIQASNLCSGVGARLCTKEELAADCTRGTGCSYDNEQIWSSTPVEFCTSDGSCEDDGLACTTNTCGLDGICTTSFLAGCAKMVVCGSSSNGACNVNPSLPSDPEELHEVRCCSDIFLGSPWKQHANCPFNVWAESPEIGNPAVCQAAKTYDQANQICSDVGARLCTEQELLNDCARGTGCSFDKEYNWSSTPYTG